MRPSPRQSDLMIVAGTVTKKMIPAIAASLQPNAGTKIRRADGRLRHPGGGPFKEGYNVVAGV